MLWDRFAIKREIERLDPVRDNQRIVYLVGSYENPWLIRKALEFALFRTYAVPHTSRILNATGQFERHGQKRYDDTTLMLAGIAEYGYESEYGQMAIAQMNRLHGRYNIRNEDMLYVLSTFVLEPTRWSERYGWRRPTANEKQANFVFWREVGLRMGIEGIPETLEAYDSFNKAHEAKYFRYDEANRRLGEATLRIFLDWYPAPLRPLVREVLYCLMDDPLLEAFGFPKPHSALRFMVQRSLWLGQKLIRFMPPRRKPFSFVDQPNRSYPQGFQVAKLGPQFEDEVS